LFVLAAVTVTLAPLAFRVPDAVPLVPTTTLPKARVVGVTASCPAVPVPVPVPSRFTVTVLAASLVIVAVALNVPAALGENVTLTGVLCPAVRVSGRLGALREKYWVEKVTLLMVTDPGPELVAVADRVLLLPAATLPKFSVAVARERVPSWTWLEEPALTPWQPARKVRAARSSNAPATFRTYFEHVPFGPVLSIVSQGTVTQKFATV
jgi:hypothetical protein